MCAKYAAIGILLVSLNACSPANPQTPAEERAIEERREQLIQRMEEQKRMREYQRDIYQ